MRPSGGGCLSPVTSCEGRLPAGAYPRVSRCNDGHRPTVHRLQRCLHRAVRCRASVAGRWRPSWLRSRDLPRARRTALRTPPPGTGGLTPGWDHGWRVCRLGTCPAARVLGGQQLRASRAAGRCETGFGCRSLEAGAGLPGCGPRCGRGVTATPDRRVKPLNPRRERRPRRPDVSTTSPSRAARLPGVGFPLAPAGSTHSVSYTLRRRWGGLPGRTASAAGEGLAGLRPASDRTQTRARPRAPRARRGGRVWAMAATHGRGTPRAAAPPAFVWGGGGVWFLGRNGMGPWW